MRGASFVGLDTLIKVPLRGGKSNPHQGRITKRHDKATVMLFSNEKSNGYANMVMRRLLAEGKDPTTFKLSPRVWGQRVAGFPIVEHIKDGVLHHYLETIYLRPGISTYFLDGNPIEKEVIQGLPVVNVSEEAQGTLGETPTKLVQIRTYALDSLVQIRIDQLNVVGPFYFKA